VADLNFEADGCCDFGIIIATAGKDRDCHRFTERVVGRSPKEHQEMAWEQMTFDLQKQIQALHEVRHQETLHVARWQVLVAAVGIVLSLAMSAASLYLAIR
jgi:hypothetical protein